MGNNTNYNIDDMIKIRSTIGIDIQEDFKLRRMIDLSLSTENDCRLCVSTNDPFKQKARENSTMCYEHIKLCILKSKYLT